MKKMFAALILVLSVNEALCLRGRQTTPQPLPFDKEKLNNLFNLTDDEAQLTILKICGTIQDSLT
jgi:hypothetical protein